MQRQPATTGLQIRVNRGRGAALLSIQPLPGLLTGRRRSADISRCACTRSAGQVAARSMGAPPPESTHFCTNVPLDSVAYCLPVAAAAARTSVARRARGGAARVCQSADRERSIDPSTPSGCDRFLREGVDGQRTRPPPSARRPKRHSSWPNAGHDAKPRGQMRGRRPRLVLESNRL
eukprot:SAG25_NODE_4570_length_788_cov_38.920174_1_plen_177_part_00